VQLALRGAAGVLTGGVSEIGVQLNKIYNAGGPGGVKGTGGGTTAPSLYSPEPYVQKAVKTPRSINILTADEKSAAASARSKAAKRAEEIRASLRAAYNDPSLMGPFFPDYFRDKRADPNPYRSTGGEYGPNLPAGAEAEFRRFRELQTLFGSATAEQYADGANANIAGLQNGPSVVGAGLAGASQYSDRVLKNSAKTLEENQRQRQVAEQGVAVGITTATGIAELVAIARGDGPGKGKATIQSVLGLVGGVLSGVGLGPAGAIVSGLGSLAAFLPQFAGGGTVPGPSGSPRLVVAHGGEQVSPSGAGEVMRGVANRLARRTAGFGMPVSAGGRGPAIYIGRVYGTVDREFAGRVTAAQSKIGFNNLAVGVA
jgi:hypothetical protein